MFEFVEKVATDIITSLGNTISQMSFDASSYDAQATENDAKAAQCEADASAEEASFHIINQNHMRQQMMMEIQ